METSTLIQDSSLEGKIHRKTTKSMGIYKPDSNTDSRTKKKKVPTEVELRTVIRNASDFIPSEIRTILQATLSLSEIKTILQANNSFYIANGI